MKSVINFAVAILLFVSCINKSSDKKVNAKVDSVNITTSDASQLAELFKSTKDSTYLLKAEKLVDSIINTGVNDIKLYQLKGKFLREKKNYKEFAEFMLESTKHFPNNPQTFFGAGLAYEKIENHDLSNEMFKKSIETYDRIINKYPTLENYVNRAIAISFLSGKEAGLKEYDNIMHSGKFDISSTEIYHSIFFKFDKSKFINDTFRNQ